MEESGNELYKELAELVKANVSGPVGRKMVSDAQKRLVNKMEQNGVVTEDEADVLRS